MSMEEYLGEIQYAVESLLDAAWYEHHEAHQLAGEVRKLTAATQSGYERAGSFALNAEGPDDVAMATGAHWETYFGADKERFHAQEELDRLLARLTTRQFSTASLAGSLLQHAKQGISIVHSGLAGCPDGRLVSTTQNLKTVIWQGRNQAQHWEEGNLYQPVRDCFDALATEADQRFGDFHEGNLAFLVLSLLGWQGWDDFAKDLRSIG